jgi:hypothetical protein
MKPLRKAKKLILHSSVLNVFLFRALSYMNRLDALGKKMKARAQIILSLAALAAAAAAMASETIAYRYDSRGRLVKVARTGTVNNNVQAEYVYDKADNRTNVNVVSPNTTPPQ